MDSEEAKEVPNYRLLWHPVSFMMTFAHVLRHVSMPDLKRWTHWHYLGNKGKTCWGYQQSEGKQIRLGAYKPVRYQYLTEVKFDLASIFRKKLDIM